MKQQIPASLAPLVHTSEATCQWLFPVPHLINNRRVKCTSPARSEGKCCCLWQESILLWYGSREKRKKEEPTEDSMQAWSRLCHIILTWRAGWKPCCYGHWISRINSAGLLSFQPRLLHKPLVCGFDSAIIFPLSSFWMRVSLGGSRKFIHKANQVCCEVTSDFQEETNESNFFFFKSVLRPWVISAEKA